MLRVANISAKVLLVALLLSALVWPDLPQYQGKAIGTRVVTYSISTIVMPIAWLLLGTRRSGRRYPHLADLMFVMAFLIDTAGNAANLYDAVSWFDDVMHFVTWVPWVVAFGLLLHYAPALPRWAHGAVAAGFGAASHIVWELLEYVTFVRDNPDEFRTAYTDTLGDLAMSLGGSLFGALLTVTVLWQAGQRAAERQSTPLPRS